MQPPKINRERQAKFLEALADGRGVIAAAETVSASRARMVEARKADPAFAAEWRQAEEAATERLEEEAWRRAKRGDEEPLVSDGKVVRDDEGSPITVLRYSDELLVSLLMARRPERYSARGRAQGLPGGQRLQKLGLIFVIAFIAWAAGSLALQLVDAHLW